MTAPYMNALSGNRKAGYTGYRKKFLRDARQNPVIPLERFGEELQSEALFKSDAEVVMYLLGEIAKEVGTDRFEFKGKPWGGFPNVSFKGDTFPTTQVDVDLTFLVEPDSLTNHVLVYSDIVGMPRSVKRTEDYAALERAVDELSAQLGEVGLRIDSYGGRSGVRYSVAVDTYSVGAQDARNPLKLDSVVNSINASANAVQRAHIATKRVVDDGERRIEGIKEMLLAGSSSTRLV